MSSNNLEKIMIANYSHVFKEMLLSAFKSHPDLTPSYVSEPIERQREIEREIDSRSREMAEFLVAKLKQKGYLAKEPADKELEALIRETLEKFGVKND